jgi:hypothetical protein
MVDSEVQQQIDKFQEAFARTTNLSKEPSTICVSFELYEILLEATAAKLEAQHGHDS